MLDMVKDRVKKHTLCYRVKKHTLCDRVKKHKAKHKTANHRVAAWFLKSEATRLMFICDYSYGNIRGSTVS